MVLAHSWPIHYGGDGRQYHAASRKWLLGGIGQGESFLLSESFCQILEIIGGTHSWPAEEKSIKPHIEEGCVLSVINWLFLLVIFGHVLAPTPKVFGRLESVSGDDLYAAWIW